MTEIIADIQWLLLRWIPRRNIDVWLNELVWLIVGITVGIVFSR